MYQLFTSWGQALIKTSDYNDMMRLASCLKEYTVTLNGQVVFQLLELTTLEAQA